MSANLIAVSVVRDKQMYERCIATNPYFGPARKVVLDNSAENLPISVRYNQFLDGGDYGPDDWLMFCHEDYEPKEEVMPLLEGLDQNAIYGPVGSRRVGFLGIGVQQILGGIEERNRDGSGKPWIIGKRVSTGTKVETLDCCCLLVHASLMKKCNLRFDKNLVFDLYVEDFCATARVQHGIVSRIVQMNAVHHSGSRATDRLFRHLPYLEKKYPHNCFSATCVYFGTRPLLMRLEDFVLGRLTRTFDNNVPLHASLKYDTISPQ